MGRPHVAVVLLFAFLVAASAKKDKSANSSSTSSNATGAPGGAGAPSIPACCDLLKPMLPFLKAESLENLQLPVLIFSRNNNGTLQPSKNRIHGSLCVCGSPNGTNQDWMKTKMGVRGSTSVRDFTRKSYGVTTKAKTGKVEFLGELVHCTPDDQGLCVVWQMLNHCWLSWCGLGLACQQQLHHLLHEPGLDVACFQQPFCTCATELPTL